MSPRPIDYEAFKRVRLHEAEQRMRDRRFRCHELVRRFYREPIHAILAAEKLMQWTDQPGALSVWGRLECLEAAAKYPASGVQEFLSFADTLVEFITSGEAVIPDTHAEGGAA